MSIDFFDLQHWPWAPTTCDLLPPCGHFQEVYRSIKIRSNGPFFRFSCHLVIRLGTLQVRMLVADSTPSSQEKGSRVCLYHMSLRFETWP